MRKKKYFVAHQRGEDFHAEYLARNFETYSELISFHRFFGGCFVSSERYHRAKLKLKNLQTKKKTVY